jgi:Mn-dependent DtxR family transcriptional regulator
MARKRIGMKKIREIIRFKETTNISVRKIARALNISRPVVALGKISRNANVKINVKIN